MTPERLGELLRRPLSLLDEHATELEALVAEYPWSGPLRVLRYRKALLDNDAAAEALWEARAEPFTPRGDRQAVARLLREGREPPLPASRTRRADGGATRDGNTAVHPCVEMAASVATADWYLHRHGHIMATGRPTPLPRERFESYRTWRDRRPRATWRELMAIDVAPDAGRAGGGKDAHEPEVASETLAELLTEQGHYERAIRMYRTLALREPAKSDTFAARIEALQLLA